MLSPMETLADRRSPLDRFRCFETRDVDEARQIVAAHFCSHRLDRGSIQDCFDACQNRVAGQHLSLNYIRYGADVTIEPGELTDFYLIQIPIRGAADVSNGCRSVASTPRRASILNPDRHTKMRWHAGCEQILLQVETGFLREVAERMAGVPVDRVRFAPDFDLLGPKGAAWAAKLRGIFGAAQDGLAFAAGQDGHQRILEEALVVALLESQANTASPLLERRDPVAAPAVLKRALHLIGGHFLDDLSLLDISSHARTSPRTLQILFKREFGSGPVHYLHDLRLAYARHLLQVRDGNRSIADIAEASGHRHFGRFSVAYKKRFGESPRETLRGQTFG
ncbi:AraC family transcriptional regulator [Roseibium sediminicola]|uniref:AraC family transcriptional regulator n=1 Tax=Roseibium sediminicola TaxID=2933272 RepID=A0ABT0GWX6_9HYPH|nr:AraC family transcriptional regulator [Roseibium sp. CAU 1639]MCK7613557.1 AraC family transcriptional regulator [Roseibium sp. CAU 1639]